MSSGIRDLRTFIELLRERGAIYDIGAPVDPVHELGAVLRACEEQGKAAFFHDVKGVGPGIGQNFVEGRMQMISGIRFDYLSKFLGELRYTWFFGGGLRDSLRDRDNVLLSLGYQF